VSDGQFGIQLQEIMPLRERLCLSSADLNGNRNSTVVDENAIGPQPAARPPPCIDFGQQDGAVIPGKLEWRILH
jgi:hypothetical protein